MKKEDLENSVEESNVVNIGSKKHQSDDMAGFKSIVQQMISSFYELKKVFEHSTNMQRITYDSLLNGLKNELKINTDKIKNETDFNLQIYSIENELMADEALGLQKKEVISGDLDVVKLLLDIDYGDKKLSNKSQNGSVFILGCKKLPQDVEMALIGKKEGDNFSIEIKYGEDAQISEFKNKSVKYDVSVLKIRSLANVK